MYRNFFKRFFDVLLCSLALLVLWPILAIIAILVKIKLGSPVIFKQDRPGKDGKIFKLYKFRTMTNAKDKDGNLLPSKERLTKFGKILRATSLDELPELINIIKGDMSIVGPRPWAVKYLKYFTEQEFRRHCVRPGLTGWAQVNGRTAANWDERIKYDIEYVDNLSLLMDIKVIFLTVKGVFCRSDIVEAGSQGNFDVYRRKQWEDGVVEKPADFVE
ncbi:MAG: sugar transferase [Clostridia bacterium]|nr:sugar transferase [Clostridia bacterium]